jgi:type IV pilus assembly protein PilA
MITVSIIGLIASIAIPNYLRFQLKAKSSEARSNIAALRTAEHSYYSEFGVYVSANASPANPAGSVKIDWINTDGAGMGFDRLGWSPEGRVFFNYAVASSAGGFTVAAGADIDADGVYQVWGYKKPDAGIDVASPTLGAAGTCAIANLTRQVVGPCSTDFGQSVF